VLQSYKLRLSDGTVLTVDHDALSTWTVDDGAMVQGADSRWLPLREFLAEAEAAASKAARRNATPPTVNERPALLVLADDLSAPAARTSGRPSRPDDALPIIPLKPLDDLDETRAGTGRGSDDGWRGDVFEETPGHDVRDERMLSVIAVLVRVLSPLADPLDRLIRRLMLLVPTGSAPRPDPPLRARGGDARPSGKPKGPRFRDKALAWLGGLTAWVNRIARRDRPSPAVSSSPPRLQAAASAEVPVRREPLTAPPSISEIPILRLADIQEPEPAETMYAEPRSFRAGWIWLRRIVVFACVVAGAVLAVLNRETWLPRLNQLGRLVFTEIDARTRSRDQVERRSRALLESTDQLPHLAPETVRLVVSASPHGALDPADVFRFASDATDRGLSALDSEEAQELTALRHRLLDALSPAERERVNDYDRARARRATLPFEDRDVLALVARGARALPPGNRERLQALAGKAIAAGLQGAHVP